MKLPNIPWLQDTGFSTITYSYNIVTHINSKTLESWLQLKDYMETIGKGKRERNGGNPVPTKPYKGKYEWNISMKTKQKTNDTVLFVILMCLLIGRYLKQLVNRTRVTWFFFSRNLAVTISAQLHKGAGVVSDSHIYKQEILVIACSLVFNLVGFSRKHGFMHWRILSFFFF